MSEKTWLNATVGACLALSLIAGCSSTSPSSATGGAAAGSAGSSGSAAAGGSGGAWVDSADGPGGIQSGNLGDAATVLDLDNVYYFDFDTSELSLDVRARLDETASVMRSKSGLVRLEGHADERGTREYNLALGERRAKAVANYLAIQGVPNSQIEVISYGEEKPAAIGQGDSVWAKNRRVELIYID